MDDHFKGLADEYQSSKNRAGTSASKSITGSPQKPV
jgi:hypothetical protein